MSRLLPHMDRLRKATAELLAGDLSGHAWSMGPIAYSDYRREAGAAAAQSYRGNPIVIVPGTIGIGLHRQVVSAR